MAAFIATARPTDLPSSLRPLRNKHQSFLIKRKKEILGALEDEGLRALVLDWLKDSPPGISKADAATLRIVTAREDGWEEALSASASGPAPKRTRVDDGAVLDREKERTRKAKEEARKAREEAGREVATERQRNAELQSKVDELQIAITDLKRSLADTARDRDRAQGELDREVRKAKARAEKAEAKLEEAKAAMRELRQSAAAATPPPKPVKKKLAAPPTPEEPTRRRRLSAPKGRFQDAPETLTEWLSAPNVHLLIDGYNVSKAEGGFGDLSLESQRIRLIEEVSKVARKHKIEATIIFDGSHIAPGTSRRSRGPVAVEYSRPDEIADDHLIAKLEGLPKYPVVVATNDRELQGRAAKIGATIATSNQLLALIRP
jgi:predicted RNA-binding protein with PIN domain